MVERGCNQIAACAALATGCSDNHADDRCLVPDLEAARILDGNRADEPLVVECTERLARAIRIAHAFLPPRQRFGGALGRRGGERVCVGCVSIEHQRAVRGGIRDVQCLDVHGGPAGAMSKWRTSSRTPSFVYSAIAGASPRSA